MSRSPPPPYKPPRDEVLLAFAEAVDAWSRVEWELMLILGILLHPNSANKSWALFHSVKSFRDQLAMVRSVGEQALTGDARSKLESLVERARGLSTKRNSLIHGTWREEEHILNDTPTHRTLFRESTGEPGGSRPTTPKETAALKGRVRFYLDDLKRAEEEFRALAGDIHKSKDIILRQVLPRLP